MYDKTKEKMNELNYESAFTDNIFMSFFIIVIVYFHTFNRSRDVWM